MAGEWIKIEHVLPGKPEVMAMAAELGISDMAVIGHLVCFWTWVDLNLSRECHAVRVTESSIDRVAGVTGFASATVKVGWLVIEGGILQVPNYEEHLSKSAKARALAYKRKQKERNLSRAERDNDRGESVTKARIDIDIDVDKEKKRRKRPRLFNFSVMSVEDLGKRSKVIEWTQKNIPQASDEQRSYILACSVRARAVGKNPVNLFFNLVETGMAEGVWRVDVDDIAQATGRKAT